MGSPITPRCGVRWGWIATNPASGTLPPRLIPRPINPPTPVDVAALITAAGATDPAMATLLVLATTSGARQRRAVRPRWSDLDPDTGELDIVRAITIVNGHTAGAPVVLPWRSHRDH